MKNLQESIKSYLHNPIIIGLIAYMTIAGCFVAFLLNKPRNEYVSFHIRQALGLNLGTMLGIVLYALPIFGEGVGLVLYILVFLFWFSGFNTAWKEEKTTVVCLGDKFQKWFHCI